MSRCGSRANVVRSKIDHSWETVLKLRLLWHQFDCIEIAVHRKYQVSLDGKILLLTIIINAHIFRVFCMGFTTSLLLLPCNPLILSFTWLLVPLPILNIGIFIYFWWVDHYELRITKMVIIILFTEQTNCIIWLLLTVKTYLNLGNMWQQLY